MKSELILFLTFCLALRTQSSLLAPNNLLSALKKHLASVTVAAKTTRKTSACPLWPWWISEDMRKRGPQWTSIKESCIFYYFLMKDDRNEVPAWSPRTYPHLTDLSRSVLGWEWENVQYNYLVVQQGVCMLKKTDWSVDVCSGTHKKGGQFSLQKNPFCMIEEQN
jgi:hypothetical protein